MNRQKTLLLYLMKAMSEKENITLVAGPCSAESREQVIGVAEALSSSGADVLRAGLWKPRTSAGKFEGVGAAGIPWMLEARERTGLKIATEVATPAHAELCIEAGFDILWIGARTTSNPFAVQQLADALRGYGGPVWVKNPISPEIELWLGAFDRLEKCNVSNLSAIHRGFSHYDHSIYRNLPQWQVPVEFRSRRPDIEMICDPSHMGGRRDLILPICQYALDLGFDGLMIEVHPDPDKALSDAGQQITPSRFKEVIESLILKNLPPADNCFNQLRGRIDECDAELISLLARRMNICREIGRLKQKERIKILQTERYSEMLGSRIEQAEKSDLSPEFIKKIFDTIHLESIAVQANETKHSIEAKADIPTEA